MKERYFTFDQLNEYDEIIHLSTKKGMNFSTPIVGIDGIEEGFRKIEIDIGYEFRAIKTPCQIHSNHVRVLTEDNLDEEFSDTDGIVTNLKNVALGIRTADCQSILLYDPERKVIGNIHSGWKGTLNKIVVNAIKLMIREYESEAKDILAFICPSIMKCCFEVDKDVKDMFEEKFSFLQNIKEFIVNGYNENKFYIDTVGINNCLLQAKGIKKENIYDSKVCSVCNSDLVHSYRAEKENFRLSAAIISL